MENRTNDSDYQDRICKAELKSQSKLRISACILEEGSKARLKSTCKPSNTLNTILSVTAMQPHKLVNKDLISEGLKDFFPLSPFLHWKSTSKYHVTVGKIIIWLM